MTGEGATILGIAAAALGGAAIGIEREWSGHARGPGARFAGVRTFTLLGGLAGMAGWLAAGGRELAGAVLLAGAAALVVAAYAAASRRSVEGTTEVAALVALAAGFTAGVGAQVLASAVVAVTVLLLVEKSRLHALVARFDDAQMRAGARFAVMAVVILPLLPSGPYGPLGGVRPRQLWTLVLFFSGLSFAGYTARRIVGTDRGYPVTGVLGGLVSSTAVTLTFARLSRTDQTLGLALAAGVLGACSVMFPRMVLAAGVLHPPLLPPLLWHLGPPFLVGLLATVATIRRGSAGGTPGDEPPNPLQLGAAVQMVVLFQGVLFAVQWARERFGDAGLLATGAVLGLTDVDALTLSMVRAAETGVALPTAARAMAGGALANTLVKLGLVVVAGRREFRWAAGIGLVAMAATLVGALLIG